jgi:predicted transcriptional regulator YdeE
MKQTRIQLPSMIIVGLYARTRNAAEMDPGQAQIGMTAQRYFQEQWAEKIPHRKTPGTTYAVYTEYESDVQGPYTYVIGEEVTEAVYLPEKLKAFTNPAQTYIKFTTQPGPMPQVVIDAWQEIWQMTEIELGGPRGYRADFELYDARACDPQKTIVDLYIGVK